MATLHPDASKEITKYINGLPPFAKRICSRLRQIILAADPDIKEDWKWGPNYNLNGMLCGYGAAKAHVKLTFFNGSAMDDKAGMFNHCVDNDFSRSVKYTDESEIDERLLTRYVRNSVAVNKKGFKRMKTDKVLDVPAELTSALKKKPKALKFFDSLSYGYKKEFVELVITAKREETKNQRLEKIVEYCVEGKTLNEKYKR